MNNLKDLLKEVKIDLTSLVLIPSGGEGGADTGFEIEPKSFLRFAKKDLNDGSERGLINALSNAKRAIDCQMDEILITLGIEYDNLPKEAETVVKYYEFSEDIPYKLKLIQSLNLAPGYITSKARLLRNKLEHYYKIPNEDSVKEAIDIAELFIRSVEGKLKLIENDFYLTDEKSHISTFEYENGFSLYFDTKERVFNLFAKKDSQEIGMVKVNTSQPEFFGLLRLMNSIDDEYECEESMKCIVSIIKHPVPKEKIKLTHQ